MKNKIKKLKQMIKCVKSYNKCIAGLLKKNDYFYTLLAITAFNEMIYRLNAIWHDVFDIDKSILEKGETILQKPINIDDKKIQIKIGDNYVD